MRLQTLSLQVCPEGKCSGIWKRNCLQKNVKYSIESARGSLYLEQFVVHLKLADEAQSLEEGVVKVV